MFQLTETLDLKSTLIESVIQTRGYEEATDECILPRILNQERDGTVIYTWDDLAANSRRSPVTHVAMYDPTTCSHKVIWTNDSKIYITTCSVNAERTLMAYTTCDPAPSRSASVQQGSHKALYRAYFAEISPQRLVFSLNIERPNYLKVQFLYGTAGGAVEKMAHMLLFLHKESIGLYRIPLARVEKLIIMRDQPVTEQLVKRFIWCQWDSLHQRLFYLTGRREKGRGEAGAQVSRPVLSGLQFSQHSKYEHMMDLPLNLNFLNVKPNVRSTYLDEPLSAGIPDKAINISVLTLSNGTLCVCCQHPVQPLVHSSCDEMDVDQPYDNVDGDELVDIKYTVTMPHHAKELQGYVSKIPWSVAKTARITFAWMNDYLMVLLPGYFVHVLDVNIEFEPCHHILLHRKTWEACQEDGFQLHSDETAVKTLILPDDPHDSEQTFVKSLTFTDVHEDWVLTHITGPSLPGTEQDVDQTLLRNPTNSVMPLVCKDAAQLGHLSPFIKKSTSMNAGCCMCDSEQGKVYQLGINTGALIHLFSSCYMEATRKAILHYVIRQGKDIFLLKQLFEMVAYDCASPEVPGLMEEFLMGMTYASLRRQVERDVFQLLPFTTSHSFRGMFEKISCGELLSRVSYVPLQSVNIGTKSVRERQQRRLPEDLWDNLCLHLRSRQIAQPSRFSQNRAGFKELNADSQKGSSRSAVSQTQEKDSFLGRISARARTSFSLPSPGNRKRSDSVLGLLPPFLSEGTLHPQQDKLINQTAKLFVDHLGKYLRKDSKIKVANVAKEYISCQMQQAKQLCHMLWSIRGPTNPAEYVPLTKPASEREYELFQLFERFYMAVQELAYPTPPGFSTYFTVMGYRSLDLSLFLQYVDRGVLMLTGEFVAQVMEDLPDDDANAQVKLQIISRLPKPLAEECFQKWDHHIAYRHTAMQQVSHLLRDGVEMRNRGSFPRNVSTDSSPYERQDLLVEDTKHMEPRFIRDVATFNTSEDLSTINF
ncbi:protein pigeon-like isoform X2 [Liolophura sinensis]|uniref:protein pigeon-like isoform X2 n=1 Tax=Liolophura sinensis TaxID=3198878 RepID=UPI003159605D